MNNYHQPQIKDIQPKVLPKELKRIWLTVIGEGFRPDTGMVLSLGQDHYPIPKSRVRFLDSKLIQVNLYLSESERHFGIEIKQNPTKPQIESKSQKAKSRSTNKHDKIMNNFVVRNI